MTEEEEEAHRLIGRLRYLLARLEGEFFHVHPDIETNGATTSLAFSSILNEALNLHEAAFKGDFWTLIKAWGGRQEWKWNEIEIRFTRWPVLEILKPFHFGSPQSRGIAGRGANNSVKHLGQYASLRHAIGACAGAWVLVLEKAREAEIYLDPMDAEELVRPFDCYVWISIEPGQYGAQVRRPLVSRVEYPSVRGRSEVAQAEEAVGRRRDRLNQRAQDSQA